MKDWKTRKYLKRKSLLLLAVVAEMVTISVVQSHYGVGKSPFAWKIALAIAVSATILWGICDIILSLKMVQKVKPKGTSMAVEPMSGDL